MGQPAYGLDRTVGSDVFSLFDAEGTEDLVFLYLQHKGWRVVPHSRKADTMSFEYSAVNPQTGEEALTQVKTGHTALNCDDYCGYRQRIFLFQSEGHYLGTPALHVTCLTRDELLAFLHEARAWIPASLRHKQDLAHRIASAQPCSLST